MYLALFTSPSWLIFISTCRQEVRAGGQKQGQGRGRSREGTVDDLTSILPDTAPNSPLSWSSWASPLGSWGGGDTECSKEVLGVMEG